MVRRACVGAVRPGLPDPIDEDTPRRIGHSNCRADFDIPSLGLVIEIKYARKGFEQQVPARQPARADPAHGHDGHQRSPPGGSALPPARLRPAETMDSSHCWPPIAPAVAGHPMLTVLRRWAVPADGPVLASGKRRRQGRDTVQSLTRYSLSTESLTQGKEMCTVGYR